MTMSIELQDIRNFCKVDGNQSVDADAFRDLCKQLNISESDADLIFDDLDLDRDGKISFLDFSNGFSNFLIASNIIDENVPEDEVKKRVWSILTAETGKGSYKISEEGKLQWLLNEMQSSEQRHLAPLVEGAIEELLESLEKLKEEKTKLEELREREKQEHENHLKKMEDEMDSQVKELEMNMKMKAQEVDHDERKGLQSRMDIELNKIAAIEKVFAWCRSLNPSEPTHDSRLNELRSKLNEAVYDNHQLRMSLLDTQTSIALMRSELLQLRSLYEEKCRELASEKEKILEVLQEQDHLSRQLNLLHDANRRLLDFHDALRISAEFPSRQERFNSMTKAKSGSIIGDYLDTNYTQERPDRCPELIDIESEEDIQGNSSAWQAKSIERVNIPVRRRSKGGESTAGLPSLNQSDSGVSSNVRDSFGQNETWDDNPSKSFLEEGDDEPSRKVSDIETLVMPEDRISKKCSSKERSSHLQPSSSENSLVCVIPKRSISEIKKQLGIKDEPKANSQRNWAHHLCSPPKGNLSGQKLVSKPKPLPRLSEVTPYDKTKGQDDSDSQLCMIEDESKFEPDGPPEQTFRVIFVGDTGVGKSSFAVRISKGVFVSEMSSTLGLDFLIRNIRVDGRNVAVQLWDTAGQERFRSVTKTFFRNADGVMLLYDCTCERSFLNVRQWIKDINKDSLQRIPMMIVANKTDLRETALKLGKTCVTTKQGEKLAKECETIFIEASAKDGRNVLPALANLIRSMTTDQDRQLSASAMQLCETKPKKKSCCGN